MYQDFFQFRQDPFSISPDPRFLYMSEQHREALAHLLYGIQSSGAFIVLSGEVGSGKTTVCRCFMEQIPSNVDIAFILNPKQTAIELLASICDELSISYPEQAGIKVLVDQLNRFLLDNHAKGRNTVLIIEEAQNLAEDVLEQLRLLTNLETSEKKLLQIILLAQPEFLEILDKASMKQLSQRITARFHLSPLSMKECEQYIQHRLSVAGSKNDPFPAIIKKRIYFYSGGVPRLINLIADRCLLGAYASNTRTVSKAIFEQASRELQGDREMTIKKRARQSILMLSSLVFVLVASISLYYFLPTKSTENKLTSFKDMAYQASSPTLADEEMLHIRSSYAGASEQLLNLWGLSSGRDYLIRNNQDLCGFASLYGLQCYSDKANLGLILKLGRPAILKLSLGVGNDNYVVLLGQQNEHLILQFADKKRTLSYQQLESLWLGDFIALVKVPEAWNNRILNPGDEGPMANWINNKLIKLGRLDDTRLADPNRYGQTSEQAIKALQAEAGIYVDGKPGLQTLIYLNTLSDDSVPVLSGISREESN